MLISSAEQRKVLKISYAVKKNVQNMFAGEYKSAFKGHGLEFEELREYTAGDDVRSIDWKVSARYGKPFVKRFREERELTIVILLDLSASLEFGTNKTKKELAAEITALISWSAIFNNDRIGMLLFSDHVERYIKPKKGKNQILQLISEVLSHEVKGKRTNLKAALEYLYRMTKKRAIIFVISDFLDDDFEDAYKIISRKHDTIAVSITDPWEKDVDFKWDVYLQDSESGEIYLNSKKQRDKIRGSLEDLRNRRENFFKKSSSDYIKLDTSRSYIDDMYSFFQSRGQRI